MPKTRIAVVEPLKLTALLVGVYRNRKVCIIIPALNEAPSIGRVIEGLFALTICQQQPDGQSDHDRTGAVGRLVDDIIVGDNGSTDATAEIARQAGAMVLAEHEPGYGAACLAALAAPVKKEIVVFVDGDHSVVADELPALLDPIVEGADLVIGSRTLGKCDKGALSIPQRFGNRVASILIRILWGAKVTDLGPFRAITNTALTKIDMKDRRFGWTVEMQVRAIQLSLKTVEVPVTTRVRIGKSKIGGTVKGVIGASRGILGTLFKLYLNERRLKAQQKLA